MVFDRTQCPSLLFGIPLIHESETGLSLSPSYVRNLLTNKHRCSIIPSKSGGIKLNPDEKQIKTVRKEIKECRDVRNKSQSLLLNTMN